MKTIKIRDKTYADVIILICLLLFAAVGLTHKKGDTVLIYKDAKLYKQLPLNVDQTVDIDGKNTLIIERGCAYMQYADCPDKLCIKQGKISDSSKDIVCLPNRVTVRITKKSETDAVSK